MERTKLAATILCIIGIIVSVYLTNYALSGSKSIACPNVGPINCENVLNSQYSTILGIPNELLGLIYFILFLALIYLVKSKNLTLLYGAVGLGFVVYYLNVERILGSICIYCTTVHVCVVLLFLLSLNSVLKDRGQG